MAITRNAGAGATPGAVATYIVVMGVSGAGKSTHGHRLASDLGAGWLEADQYHAATSIEKMSRGEALQDDDRLPWLDRIADVAVAQSGQVVIACSALKRRYRDHLKGRLGTPPLFLFLDIAVAPAAARLAGRKGHFFNASLLDSQFEDLQPPSPDEWHFTVNADDACEDVYAAIRQALGV